MPLGLKLGTTSRMLGSRVIQLGLEELYPSRDRRLDDMQVRCRNREAAALGNRQEGSQQCCLPPRMVSTSSVRSIADDP